MRLHPLTERHPKPMLKVGGKPILQQIIEGFVAQGFRKIWLAVNYKADLIIEHFDNGRELGAEIRYVRESEPLGTGGAINLLPRQPFHVKPFIVKNGDVLAEIRYPELMEHHASTRAQLTVCLGLHQYQVPYGVADIDGHRLVDMREKPIENILVNAGVYVLDPCVFDIAPSGAFDLPGLVDKLDRVSVYPIEGYWSDVGTFQDLAAANTEWRA